MIEHKIPTLPPKSITLILKDDGIPLMTGSLEIDGQIHPVTLEMIEPDVVLSHRTPDGDYYQGRIKLTVSLDLPKVAHDNPS